MHRSTSEHARGEQNIGEIGAPRSTLERERFASDGISRSFSAPSTPPARATRLGGLPLDGALDRRPVSVPTMIGANPT